MNIAGLKRFLSRLWRWIGAAPVALKLIGLVVLPLLLVSTAGALFVLQRLQAHLAARDPQPVDPDFVLSLAVEGALFLGLGALVGLVLAGILTWVLVRPLRSLTRAMRRVQSGDLAVEVPVWAADEIGEVQAEFNVMVAQLRGARDVLLQQQIELETLNHENARLLADVRSQSERLQHLWSHALNAQEAERKRLARELHDETGQALTSIVLQLKTLQDETDPAVIADRLNGLRYLTSRTLEEVRRLSMDLRPVALDDLGIVAAIRWYAQECAERNGVTIEFDATEAPRRLPAAVEIVLYRAVQEGLTNVIRHARAKRVQIALGCSDHAAWLTIADDGKGMAAPDAATSGLGLAGMRERVAMAGGRLTVDSKPDMGTRLIIELPLVETHS